MFLVYIEPLVSLLKAFVFIAFTVAVITLMALVVPRAVPNKIRGEIHLYNQLYINTLQTVKIIHRFWHALFYPTIL
jgi:hypothetical protein